MIIYHPYKDANHCAYRIIRILYAIDEAVHIDFLRIAEFYCLFPSELKYIESWPRQNSKDSKIVNAIPDCYEKIGNPKMLFHDMSEVFENTLMNLISQGIVSSDTDHSKHCFLRHDALPESLASNLKGDVFCGSEEFSIITQKLVKVNLGGKSGLKAKTGLLEYRYD